MERKARVGIVGTGFVARGLALALERQPDLVLSRALTRREPAGCPDFPRGDLLTGSLQELIDHSDLVVECSGDPIHGTDVLDEVMKAELPVVTMNAQLQVCTGSYLARRGLITEAEGDQPGCLAALREDVVQSGFRPLVYGNIKGFLNLNPTAEEMHHWAKRQGLRMEQVISFTDGTKVQFEQALVANGLGASIARNGLMGVASDDLMAGADLLAEEAKRLGRPISDYVLSPGSPKGVFVVAEHDESQREYLRYLNLGDGPHYLLLKSYILCHLEALKTIRRVLTGGGVLINNSLSPTVSVAAVAKRPLEPGETMRRGLGSFDVRGEAVTIESEPGHIPIGLLAGAVVTRRVDAGRRLSFEDVEVPESLALRAWKEVAGGAAKTSEAADSRRAT